MTYLKYFGHVVIATVLCRGAYAQDNELLSIEALMDMEVTSVSKKPQSITQSAASVFVITREDIRRSGAISVPEALRLAPGINVGRIGANRWAVSIRGHVDRFANKLLVMLDGRTLYTPLFAGVLWETQDIMLEEVERIEVIRGPGAAVWGANAVNGVINIITRHAGDSQGTLVSATLGSEERGSVSLRQGVSLAEDSFLRVTAKWRQVDDSINLRGEPANDNARNLRLDGRWDGHLKGGKISMGANYYRGTTKDTETLELLIPPWRQVSVTNEEYDGVVVTGNWRYSHDSGAETSLLGFLDYSRIWLPYVEERRHTFDLEFQRREVRRGRHEWIWGGGYRTAHDNISQFNPESRKVDLYSIFVQDEIELTPRQWTLTLGGRVEHNGFSGLEMQPNARLLWHPREDHGLWLSVSRATRTPSRAESDMRLRRATFAPGSANNPSPLPVEVVAFGNPDLKSEVLRAVEIGYRGQLSQSLSLECVGFFHKYNRLVGFAWDGKTTQLEGTTIVIPMPAQNTAAGQRGRGAEVALDWRPAIDWRIEAAYSYLDSELEHAPHHASLRISHNLSNTTELDLWLKHVAAYRGTLPTSEYSSLDLRLAWKPRLGLEFALVGQNLLSRAHSEKSVLLSAAEPTQIERGIYLKAEWSF